MSPTITVNGGTEFLQASTVAELLRQHGVTHVRGVAVAINRAVVPSSRWSITPVSPGDEIEIVRPFGGG